MTSTGTDDGALFELPTPDYATILPENARGWPEQPIAQVILDSAVPHLDRRFDYLVPPELDEQAQPGVRIKVRFGHQTVTGWLVHRSTTVHTGARLMPIRSVVSALPVLRPQVLKAAEKTAARSGGTVADVLRNVVPPRIARVEKQMAAELATDEVAPATAPSFTEEKFDWTQLEGGAQFLSSIEKNTAHRVALTLPSGHGKWDSMGALVDAAHRTAATGRAVVIVVPDVRQLNRLCNILDERVGEQAYARLTGHNGPTPRYRDFLRTLTGQRLIAVGTRSAVWAPAEPLGLIIVWDESDTRHSEPRAPYYHTRDVALLRAEEEQCSVLFASPSRSVEIQRMVEAGYIHDMSASRELRRTVAPRILATADSFYAARDPLAHIARLPGTAWQAARNGLAGTHGKPGPVLVQVARAGFIPGLFCDQCASPARCRHCRGPLSFPERLAAARGEAACRWCGQRERHFRCGACGSTRLRAGSRGVDRTAEELGRAFPNTPVLASSADHILTTITDTPALVISTTGAEPIAEGGYAAALLLDGDSQLQRDGLRVPETVLGHWMRATGLVRSADEGGVVVVTAQREDIVGALVRMDPVGFASREWAERQQLGLPPATRSAEVTGLLSEVQEFTASVELPYQSASSPWIGPVLLEQVDQEERYRSMLFFPYSVADQVVAALRAARAAASARRSCGSVRVRMDPLDML